MRQTACAYLVGAGTKTIDMVKKMERQTVSAENKKAVSPPRPKNWRWVVILLAILTGVGVLTSKKESPTPAPFLLAEGESGEKRWREFRRYYKPTPEEEEEIMREYDFDESLTPWVRDFYEGYRGTLTRKQIRELVFQDMAWQRCIARDCQGIERVVRLMHRLGIKKAIICNLLHELYEAECCEYVVDDLLDEFCPDGSEDDDPEEVF